MPDPDTPIDRLLDRLVHADLYHVWHIADGFLNGETLGSAWIPPSPRTTDTPQQPNIGSRTGYLQAITNTLAETAVRGMV